jgi:hypothetical protein
MIKYSFLFLLVFLNISSNTYYVLAEEPNLIDNLAEDIPLATINKNLKINDDNFKSVFFGHLLTPTTHLPTKKVWSLGTHVTGYSFTDNLLIGSSSFLYLFYNSPNLFLKYGEKINKTSKWAIQFDYLKSTNKYSMFSKNYVMEAAMLWGVWSVDVTDFYSLHTSLNYMYFFNEGNPHSLRREPFNNQPYQFSLTTLHDVRVTKKYGLASEFGILGINYQIPNIHGAVSFRYTDKNLLLQFGLSFDVHLLVKSFDKDEYIATHPTLGNSHTKDFITHPELAIQYFF